MKIFCVIPAYNEEKNIARTIKEVSPLVDVLVVVDDGSADATRDLAQNCGATVLRHIINRGQGAALRTGTEYCLKHGADIIVHFDADNQFLSREIARVVAPIKSGQAQVVFGSRFLNNQLKMPWAKRYLLMPLAKSVNKIFFNVNLTDPQSGFRAMSAAAAGRVSWRQDRMAHCSEIMLEVKKNNFYVKEVPITAVYHHFGQNLNDGFKILKDLFFGILLN